MNVIDRAISQPPVQNVSVPHPQVIGPSDPGPRPAKSGLSGNLAPAINASTPGDPKSPMDHVKIIRRHSDPRVIELEHVPVPTPETCAAIAAHWNVLTGDTLATDAEIQALRKLDVEWIRLKDLQLAHHPGKARELFDAHKSEIVSQITDAAAEATNLSRVMNLAEFENDLAAKRKLIHAEVLKISDQAHQLVAPFYSRFVSACDAVAEAIEKEERAQCDLFCLPFSGSPVLLAVRKAALVAQDSHQHFYGNQPRRMVGFLPIPNLA